MPLKGFYKTDVVTITPDQPVSEAAALMRDRHVGNVVVVESREGRRNPVGLLTDRDIVICCVASDASRVHEVKVRDVMTPEPILAREYEGIYEVAQKMRKSGVSRMPVVGNDGELLGIITSKNILALISDELIEVVSIADAQREAGEARAISRRNEAVSKSFEGGMEAGPH